MSQARKAGLIVILVPALSVIAISVLVELLPRARSDVSLWHRVAPFALNWGIGIALVLAGLLFVKLLARRDHDHNS